MTGLEIAVIGMACKFPQANSIEEFWDNLKNGVDSIEFLNKSEIEEFVPPELYKNPNYVNSIGSVIESKEEFDADFFGYTPIEATIIDPQNRLFHECVYQAINNGGYNPEKYKGLIGLFGSASPNLMWQAKVFSSGIGNEMGYYAASNYMSKDQMCTQVSYKLNLRGPSVFINTACSSSLVAIHMASQSILNGECDMAVAGGVSVNTERPVGYIYQDGMIQSKDGKCLAFDEQGSGTVGGEGCGVVLLKLLDDAIKDNDDILAVINGSAINNDGKLKLGYTAPSIEGQCNVIRSAQNVADIDPDMITYIETHGTGTELGDPIEIMALNQAFNSEKRNHCALGALKTNIGHLDAAAGVAGFIKVVLALNNKQIPPILNYNKPNPKIDFKNSPFYVNTKLENWKANGYPLTAAVSSFGIGGTNAHIILQEADKVKESAENNDFNIFSISTKSQQSLKNQIKDFKEYFERKPQLNVKDICYTLHNGRSEFNYRYSIDVKDYEGLIKKLKITDESDLLFEPCINEELPAVFMFSGQGSQYINMASDLYHSNNLFRNEMDNCFELLPKSLIGLKDILFSQDSKSKDINNTLYTQPLLFIVEYGMAKLLMSFGVKPSQLIGHSIGEYVAACLSGVFSLRDALSIVSKRASLMSEMPKGSMISVPLTEGEVKKYLNENVSLAVINHKNQCILSGSSEEILKISEKISSELGIECINLHTSHAFHSHMMEPMLDNFKKVFEQVKINKPKIPIYLNYTGLLSNEDTILDAEYWANHLRNCVKFSDSVSTILETKKSVLIEIGPGNTISSLLNSNEQKLNTHYVINTIRHIKNNTNDCSFFYSALSKLWTLGIKIDWNILYSESNNRRVSLPGYSFDRQRYWIDSDVNPEIHNQLAKTIAKKEDIDNWFYLPRWEQLITKDTTLDNIENNIFLLFIDRENYYKYLLTFLENNGCEYLLVESGDNLDLSNLNKSIIRPHVPEDYISLFKQLKGTNKIPSKVFHLWNISKEEKSSEYYIQNGYYSLLYTIQSILSNKIDSNLEIISLTYNLYDIYGNKPITAEKSTILGLVNVANQELVNIRCSSIDIELPVNSDHDMKNQIKTMFNYLYNPDRIHNTVALKNRKIWYKDYVQMSLDNKDNLIRNNGVYLITGGLGQIGLLLTKYLCETYSVQVILVNRSVFPDESEWDEILIASDKSDQKTHERIQVLKSIKEKGGKVIIKNEIDISDYELFNSAVQEIEQKHLINGVFHTAGVTANHIIYSTIENTSQENSNSQFNAKVVGSQNINKIFNDRDIDFCFMTSSLAANLGGIGFSAYSAANTFMDYFVEQLNKESSFPWQSVNFDGWALDQDQNNENNSEEIMAICRDEGMEVIERVLSNPNFSNILVSVTDLRHRLNQWIFVKKEDTEKSVKPLSKRPRPQLSVEYVEPKSEVEKHVGSLFSDFLGYSEIGLLDSFFDLGGNSLQAIGLVNRIFKELNVKVSLNNFFEHQDLGSLSEFIEKANKSEYSPIQKVLEKDHYELSSAQKRLYFLYEFDKDSLAYNLPYAIKIEGDLDKERLNNAFKRLIDRHEGLRTSFEVIDGEVVQKISKNIEFDIEYFQAKEEDAQQIIETFISPFNLNKAPLIRVGLIEMSPEENVLMIDIHHIITDGVSEAIFSKDLISLYNQEELKELTIQYKDYAEWQQGEEYQSSLSKQKEFWLNEFSEQSHNLELPFDFVRPKIKGNEGSKIDFRISKEETQWLKSISEDEGVTMFMVLLAVYNILFAKLSNQEDITIGSPIAGRQQLDLEKVFGLFVNTLPLRNYPKDELSFKEFLLDLKSRLLSSIDNQGYQYEDLINELKLERDASRNPLFDNVFVLQNFEGEELEIPGLVFKPFNVNHSFSKFDIVLLAAESEDQIFFRFEYSTSLYKQETIERFIGYFKNIINQIGLDVNKKIADIKILSKEEKDEVLSNLNNAGVDYPSNKTVIDLFNEQVKRNANNTALKLGEKEISYKQLDELSTRLAVVLQERGISSDDVVGLLTDRSIETIIGIIAILKAGGAYLPIDVDYPKERINYIIKDSGSKLILTNTNIEELGISDAVVILSIEETLKKTDLDQKLKLVSKPSDLCYIIYTSGTTGKPKGVMLEHRNVVRLFCNDEFQFDFDSNDVWTMFHSHCFDFSVWEIFGALLFGGKLVIIPKSIAIDTLAYLEILKEEKVSILNQTPSAFYNLQNEELDRSGDLLNLRYVIFGGEALSPGKLNNWRNKYPGVKLINMFGITETTVHVTYKEIGEYEIENNISNVGKPIPTLSVYILDKYQNIAPKGVIGEMFVGGAGVARGYIGKQKLTEEKFIPNPYNANETLYRSGDLAKVLSNGEIEYIGRIDNQIQLHGFRIELGEIEYQLCNNSHVQAAVVLEMEKGENNYLIAYYVSEKEIDIAEIKSHLSNHLPDYMLPSYYVHINRLPLTSNGKIDRAKLPEPELNIVDDYVAPSNEIEESLAKIWAEILNVQEVSINSNFFILGGDSIIAIKLISAIRKKIKVNINISDLFVSQTIKDLAAKWDSFALLDAESEILTETKKELSVKKNFILSKFEDAESENIEDVYPATDIQKGMIFHSLKELGVYHDQMVHFVQYPEINIEKMDRALKLMTQKHSILRTSFYAHEDDLLQVVRKDINIQVSHFDISEKNGTEQKNIIKDYLIQDKNTPFDFDSQSFWRFVTFTLSKETLCACFICHHAIIDGWSDASFNTELNNIYLKLLQDPEFAPQNLMCSYKDFVIDQIVFSKNEGVKQYWETELSEYKRFSFPAVQ